MTSAFTVRPLTPADRDWVREKIIDSWEADVVVAHGELFRPTDLPGFAAFADGEPVGLLTFHIEGTNCEIVTLDSWTEGMGVGTALIEATKQAARQAGSGRLFLVTTNNNLHALRFYQKRGFTICAVRLNIMEQARRLKPEIPPIGADGIPIRDEIELEIIL